MHRTIDFPNLGIHLKSVGDHITVFGFDIAYYGIVIGIGILAGLMMAVMEAKRTHQNVEDYYDLAIYGVIFSIIGARAYYVIFSWDMYKDDIKSIINIREGGLAIYGGVITAIVVVFIFAKIKGLSPFLLFDTGGFGLITGQMIGRLGELLQQRSLWGIYEWTVCYETSGGCGKKFGHHNKDVESCRDSQRSHVYSGSSDLPVRIPVVSDGADHHAVVSQA